MPLLSLLPFHLCTVLQALAFSEGLAPSPERPPIPASSLPRTADVTTSIVSLDLERLQKTIVAGRVYQHFDFLTPHQVDELLQEIQCLEVSGAFARKGLSNTADRIHAFGQKDRSICAVPWWKDVLHNAIENHSVGHHINQLRLALSDCLHRPSMADSTLAHECYYSTSKVGSKLPRHMDERHEELKGTKGWILPSRRSLSWLIYLSDPDWSLERQGGALRAFPQARVDRSSENLATSTHNENLQIGWLQQPFKGSQPVYLDSWYVPFQSHQPHSILYTIHNDQVTFLTKPWLTESLHGTSVSDFLHHWAKGDAFNSRPTLFLTSDQASQFALLEDRMAWDAGHVPTGSIVRDVAPVRASLVVFDSVLVPHQVETVTNGTRVALAGWLHEETQPFPENIEGLIV